MSKTLRTAAVVVGAVALVATGIGAAASLGAFGAVAGSAAAASGAAVMSAGTAAFLGTAATVATVASAAAGIFSLGAALTAKKPSNLASQSGAQERFTIRKDQGIPLALGRTGVAGFMTHQMGWDTPSTQNNTYFTRWAVWSAGGPIEALESFAIDKAPVTFDGDAAQGAYAGSMYMRWQPGWTPEDAALIATGTVPYPSGWSAASKMSGHAGYALTVVFDGTGKTFPSGLPQPLAVIKGRKAWDPRQDSTYPGGLGSQRADDPATWAWTENPWLLAIDWARGIWANGRRVMGIGFALSSITLPAFVEAANVADANGWTCGGVVYSTDRKMDVLRKICAAGGGKPIPLGGRLTCTFDTPRVPIATITTADIMPGCSVTATPPGAERINGIIPTFRSEDHDWGLVPAPLVQIPEYVAEDGRPRTRAVTWELVQKIDQLTELSRYRICNEREFGPIVVPLKIRWMALKPGDCIRIESPEAGMDGQDVVIQKRHLDPSTGGVTLTCRSETYDKHAFSLGHTGTPPATPSLQVVDREHLLIPGYSAGWSGVRDDDGNRPADRATVGMTPDEAAIAAAIEAAIAAAEATITSLVDQADQAAADIIALGGEVETATTLLTTQGSAILANSLAISNVAGDLASYSMTVSAGKPNLLPNGDYSAGLDGWVASGGLAVEVYTDAIGTYANIVNPTGGTLFFFKDITEGVSVGATYYGSFEGDPVSGVAECYVQALDGEETDLGISSLASAVGWNQRSVTGPVVAPPGTVKIRLLYAIYAGAHVAVTRSMIQQGGATIWQDQATVKLTQQAVATLTGDYATLALALDTQGAAIALNAGAISTTNSDLAIVTTKLGAGRPNLLSNGDYSAGLTGWVASGGLTISIENDAIGTYANINNPTGGTLFFYKDITEGIVPGRTYYGSFEGDPVAGLVQCIIQALDAGGSSLGQSTPAVATGWETRSVTGPLITPAGTAKLRILYVFYAGGHLAMTRSMVQQGAATIWQDQATVKLTQSALTTLDSQYTALSAELVTQGAQLSISAVAITTLEGYAASRFQVTAVSGGRAQLTIHSDSNGGGGVDIVGDVRIHGSLITTGSITFGELGLNAASMPVTAMTVATINPTTSWTDIQSASIATVGGPVLINMGFFSFFQTLDPDENEYRLLRDGVVIFGPVSMNRAIGFNTTGTQTRYNFKGNNPASFMDGPAPGGHTYTLQARRGSVSTDFCSVYYRVLNLVESRR